MKIFDTHCHLNVDAFAEDLNETIVRAHEADVARMAVVGFDDQTITRALSLAEQHDALYAIIGWHPTEAASYTAAVETRLQEQLRHPKVVALGEIGLDYYWKTALPSVQQAVFRRQIALAKNLDLPIVIHCREAIQDTYTVLKEEGIPAAGGIMHSFSGDVWQMQQFLDLGMHISLSGVVTFKKATDLHEVAQHVPLDRLLVETDAPYLAPVPFRGKRNEPAYTAYVVQEIARLRGLTEREIGEATYRNALSLFRLTGEIE